MLAPGRPPHSLCIEKFHWHRDYMCKTLRSTHHGICLLAVPYLHQWTILLHWEWSQIAHDDPFTNFISAPPCLQQMLLQLPEYDLSVGDHLSCEMLLTDTLSRLLSKLRTEEIPSGHAFLLYCLHWQETTTAPLGNGKLSSTFNCIQANP